MTRSAIYSTASLRTVTPPNSTNQLLSHYFPGKLLYTPCKWGSNQAAVIIRHASLTWSARLSSVACTDTITEEVNATSPITGQLPSTVFVDSTLCPELFSKSSKQNHLSVILINNFQVIFLPLTIRGAGISL